MKLGYVCTNYNNTDDTREAVRSLSSNGACPCRIVVVDNHSSQENVAALKDLANEFQNVRLILSQENVGYFPGLNLGIRCLRSEEPDINMMIVGNNDLLFPPDFGDSLARNLPLFEKYPVVSPDIVTLDGVHQNPHVIHGISKPRECVYELYYANYYLGMAIRQLASLTRKFTDRRDETQHAVAQEIYQGYGACYLLGPVFFRHFEELWAPTFLMHEEFFLTKQLRDKGLRIFYEPSIAVLHRCHGAMKALPARKTWEAARSSQKIYRQHVRVADFLLKSAERPYQVCSNCVMDTSDPKIRFDRSGVCDHCSGFYKHILPKWQPNEAGRKVLDKKVEQIKKAGAGKEFDCILGISGGADSSYLTYLAKEQLGLRPLVFHVDAGWNSQIAVNNIEKIIDGLGLELFTVVIDWKEMRDLQLAFFKSGVPHIDLPQDHAFFATMYRFAEQHKVKYILTGANTSTECVRNPLDYFYYGTDMWQIRDIHRRFGQIPLEKFPFSGILRHKVYLRYFKGIEVVKPLDYLPYVKKDAMELLSKKFGWQIYPRKHFESRFTKFYEGYWLPKKFGFDTRRVQYSSLILTGQMTREEALAALAQPPYDEETIAHDFEYISTKLGITISELQGYMDAPSRSFKDYRNQLYLFLVGARVMQLMGLERAAVKR